MAIFRYILKKILYAPSKNAYMFIMFYSGHDFYDRVFNDHVFNAMSNNETFRHYRYILQQFCKQSFSDGDGMTYRTNLEDI